MNIASAKWNATNVLVELNSTFRSRDKFIPFCKILLPEVLLNLNLAAPISLSFSLPTRFFNFSISLRRFHFFSINIFLSLLLFLLNFFFSSTLVSQLIFSWFPKISKIFKDIFYRISGNSII